MRLINKKKVLVLGGSGLLGTHFVSYFSNKYNVDWTFNNELAKKEDGIFFSYDGNKNKIRDIIEKSNPDIIINTIGLVSVDKCETNPDYAVLLNSSLVKSIVEVIKDLDLKNCYLVQISSGGVYGDRVNKKDTPWGEDDELNPLSIYAKTKLQGEMEAYKNIGKTLVVRSDFYGLNFMRDRQTLLSWIIYQAENNIEMEGWENVFFSPISAYYLVQTIEKITDLKLEGVINIGSVDGCNKYDFVETVCNKINLIPQIHRINTDKRVVLIRPRYSVLNCKKLKSIMNYSYTWEEGLNEYINNYYIK